jgi:hypothetical protein
MKGQGRFKPNLGAAIWLTEQAYFLDYLKEQKQDLSGSQRTETLIL